MILQTLFSSKNMKRLILSRKGFDAKAGGVASPILRDGRIYSLPIPQDYPSSVKYRDLNFDGISGDALLKEASASISPDSFCHLDPLLNKEIGIFGQASSSQTELKNKGVSPGDLFLFFGWFKDFFNKGSDLHHLFGWLQIEKVIEGTTFIGFMALAYGILTPAKAISKASYKVKNGIAAADRVFEILKESDTMPDLKKAKELTSFESSIELKNVSFKYDNEFVLKDFS